MKKLKVSTLLFVGALLLGISATGVGVINAQTTNTTTNRTNSMLNFVTAIAQKFNLNAADVQSVVDTTMQTQHAARQAEMLSMIKTKISTAVSAGTITQAQADLITAKTAELKASMEADRVADQNLTQEQRKAKMQERMTALKSWATTNNIPEQLLRFMGGGKGFGHGGPRGFDKASQPVTSSTTSS